MKYLITTLQAPIIALFWLIMKLGAGIEFLAQKWLRALVLIVDGINTCVVKTSSILKDKYLRIFRGYNPEYFNRPLKEIFEENFPTWDDRIYYDVYSDNSSPVSKLLIITGITERGSLIAWNFITHGGDLDLDWNYYQYPKFYKIQTGYSGSYIASAFTKPRHPVPWLEVSYAFKRYLPQLRINNSNNEDIKFVKHLILKRLVHNVERNI